MTRRSPVRIDYHDPARPEDGALFCPASDDGIYDEIPLISRAAGLDTLGDLGGYLGLPPADLPASTVAYWEAARGAAHRLEAEERAARAEVAHEQAQRGRP